MTDDLCLLDAHTCSSPPGERGASRAPSPLLGPAPPAPAPSLHIRASRALHAPPRPGVPDVRGGGPAGTPALRVANASVTCRQSPWRRSPRPVSCPGPGWGVWRKDSQNPSSRPESRSYLVTTTSRSGERGGRRGSRAPQVAYACAARPLCARATYLSAHARYDQLAPRRHFPESMLLGALGHPLSQIFAIVFRLCP